ncbi:phosphinothricin acetyltransferase [Micromonospora pattaloongensis]|uniref:Phosphinothricin acetyltransferase n=1 Tax=Micromonospora pattaloongensis TaxID=405436 RepID=A0A1H3LVG7_9ACTN|nr:GNAT family N-acetyltransferase [Micromonospora pattaloongensis]SDY68059.1 phosphinothricin acetyltransferase [Micromonospora pattaloongensis]
MALDDGPVRPATPGDLAAIAAIYAHYVETSIATFDEVAPTVADWERKAADLAARGLPLLIADDGEVAGYAYAAPWRPKPAYRHTVEDSIYLAPGHTGKGLGRALLAALLDRCGAAGARQVIAVITDSGDPGSLTLHRRLGFVDAGRLTAVGFKHGRWIDTLLLQRDLTDATADGPGPR